MTNLATTCFTVQDGKIIEGTLSDFTCFIESTTRPTGVGYKYYSTTVEGDVWALVKWATWSGPEVIVQEFDSEQEANTAAEETYVQDILNNSEMQIHLDRGAAERELADFNE